MGVLLLIGIVIVGGSWVLYTWGVIPSGTTLTLTVVGWAVMGVAWVLGNRKDKDR